MAQPDIRPLADASARSAPPGVPPVAQGAGASSAELGGRRPSARSRRDFLTGAAGRPAIAGDYWIRVHRRAMACRFEITLASQDAVWVPAAGAALNDVDRVEAELSVFREGSVISHVNRTAAGQRVALDERLFRLLNQCGALHAATGGAFDITSTPLSRCWGFLDREGHVPSQAAIDAARAVVGFTGVELDRAHQTVSFRRPGIELNLGGIGKGYALDRVAAGMRSAGAAHALLSAGRSSLLAVGGREGGWCVDLVSVRRERTEDPERPLARVWLRDAALGTSGAGEQFVIADGTRYGHVIDPRSGWPASGVLSASVIASSAAEADALSTAFLIGGVGLAERYCADHPGVMALVTPDDGSDAPLIFGTAAGAIVKASACGPSAVRLRQGFGGTSAVASQGERQP